MSHKNINRGSPSLDAVHRDAEPARLSEERMSFALQATNDGLWDWDLLSNKAYFSPSYYLMLGYKTDEFPASYESWRDLVHPEDLPRCEKAIQKAVEAKRGYDLEFRMRTKSGDWKWVQSRGKVMEVNAQGRPIRMVGTHIDISERKKVELERSKLEAQNRQLHKMESLGRMAGAIAHHFNNQLQAVMGNLELAMSDPAWNGAGADNLDEAMQAARRAAEVGRLMLTYLGQTRGAHELLDVSEICNRSLPMLRAVMPKNVELVFDMAAPGPVINANANHLQQILTNLLTNAWEAMGAGKGMIRLAVKKAPAAAIQEGHRFPIDWQPQDADYACLEVADAGCGITQKDIEKLCDPFFSTKFVGRGMGLSVVLGMVKAHGGAITVESKAGRGSVFRVFFPIAAHAIPGREITEQPSTFEEGGTVLLIEDEEVVRKMAASMLGRLGFAVLEAQNGVEGVEVFRQQKEAIRCVLCDLTMPRMDGWETLVELRKLAPGFPVVLASGYEKAQVMAGHHPEWPQAFLGKPYDLKELRQAVSQALKSEAKM